MATGKGCFFDRKTLAYLLETCVVKQGVPKLSPSAFRCFWPCFKELFSPEIDSSGMVDIDDLVDLSSSVTFLWTVATECNNSEVARDASSKLLDLNSSTLGDNLASFLKECVTRLSASVTDVKAASASPKCHRITHRLLTLIRSKLTKVKTNSRLIPCKSLTLFLTLKDLGSSMPPVPSHQSSFRGQTITLEVSYGKSRVKLFCHANEYVGSVRARVAENFNTSISSLRIFAGGEINLPTITQRDLCSRLFTHSHTSGKEVHDSQMIGTCSAPNRLVSESWAIEGGLKQSPHSVMIMVVPPSAASSADEAGVNTAEKKQVKEDRWHATSTTALLSQTPGLYSLLFDLSGLNGRGETKEEADLIREEAARLLQILPTSPEVSRSFRALLASHAASEEMEASDISTLLLKQGSISPPEMLYSLQALHGLIFPIPSLSDGSDTVAFSNLALGWASSKALSLLNDILNLVEKQAAPSSLLREFHTISTLIVSNLIEAHTGWLKKEAGKEPNLARPLESDDRTPRAQGNGKIESLAEVVGPVEVALEETPTGVAADAVAGLALISPRGCSDALDSLATAAASAAAATAAAGGGGGESSGGDVPIIGPQLPPPLIILAPPSKLPCTPIGIQLPIQTIHLEDEALSASVSLLVRLITRISRLPLLDPRDCVSDASLARDCLGNLTFLLSSNLLSPSSVSLFQQIFLSDPSSPEMVKEALINSPLGAVRDCLQQTFLKICVPPSTRQSSLASSSSLKSLDLPRLPMTSWLLRLLSKLIPGPDDASQAQREVAMRPFFSLLIKVISSLPLYGTSTAEEGSENDPPSTSSSSSASSLWDLAEIILQSQVKVIHSSLGPMLVGQQEETAGAALPPSSHLPCLLEGRLRLVHELAKVLDCESKVGCSTPSGSPGLIQLLLRRLLFPEAAIFSLEKEEDLPSDLKTMMAEQALDLPVVPECRAVAFSLLSDLITSSGEALEEGSDILYDLHLQKLTEGGFLSWKLCHEHHLFRPYTTALHLGPSSSGVKRVGLENGGESSLSTHPLIRRKSTRDT